MPSINVGSQSTPPEVMTLNVPAVRAQAKLANVLYLTKPRDPGPGGSTLGRSMKDKVIFDSKGA